MTDLTKTIAPKSDQLNADDLIGGPRTITVTGVKLLSDEQPVGINFEGDNGKPYKPCKSMRRVLVMVWGGDGAKYIGRSMTIFNDPEVMWGGAKVGGVRISHMSHIDREKTLALTVTRGNKKSYKVRPLATEGEPKREESRQEKTEAPAGDDARTWATKFRATIAGYTDAEKLQADYAKRSGELTPNAKEFMDSAVNERLAELEIPE